MKKSFAVCPVCGYNKAVFATIPFPVMSVDVFECPSCNTYTANTYLRGKLTNTVKIPRGNISETI